MARLSVKKSFWRSKLSQQLKFLSSISVENKGVQRLRSVQAGALDWVIPACSAGVRLTRMFSGSILANLDAGYPCRHDEVCIAECYNISDKTKILNAN